MTASEAVGCGFDPRRVQISFYSGSRINRRYSGGLLRSAQSQTIARCSQKLLTVGLLTGYRPTHTSDTRTASTSISELKILGVIRYRVTYPTVNGRKRELYVDEKKAEKRLKEIKDEQKRFGQSLTAMTSTTRADAAAAEKILAGSGLTLVEAARLLMEHKRREQSGKPIEEAAQAFLISRNDTSERHRKTIATRINYMTRFLAGHTTASVTAEDIQRLLDGLDREPVTRDNYKRCMSSFFAFCMDPARKWCSGNPASAAAPITIPKSDVEILTPQEAAAILTGCDEAILPGVVLGMFCGLRNAEIARLQWSAVDLAQGHVTVGTGIAKTGARRVCPLPDCAKAWLAPYALNPKTAIGVKGSGLLRN